MAAGHDVRIIDGRTPEERGRPFLAGTRQTWLLPLYDVFARVSGVRGLHQRAVELAGVAPGQAVLDVGCGTGNLSFAVLDAQPGARVTGLDPDGAALRRAARKARRRGVSLTLVQGYADRIPAEDASLDHVVSALALHHLDDDGRLAFTREALRALRPGGVVTIVDFGGPATAAEAAGHPERHHGPGHALRHLPGLIRARAPQSPAPAHGHDPGHDQGHDDGDDDIVALLTGAGFGDAREVAHVDHRFGRMAFVQAARPS